jgi:hypothetical protein
MRLALLHYLAKLMGIQFKIDGLPYGSELPVIQPFAANGHMDTGPCGGHLVNEQNVVRVDMVH